MTIVPPAPDEPRRPLGPQDPGDAWVVAPTGEKYWGRFGAAGVLAVDRQRGVLLQHRVGWSHFGGTWGIPGGALHEGESALDGALREAQEEAGIPDGALHARFARVLDLEIWSYTTVVADVLAPFDPVISDPESLALEWVPVDEVDQRPLHPGFGAAWPLLRSLLAAHPAIVVDAANVVGSVPDGWWKDRMGAASRLHARLSAWAAGGVDAEALGLEADRWFPPVSMVVEGAARAIPDASHQTHGARVAIVRADGAGDDAIVEEARCLLVDGSEVTAVTSDRGLTVRLEEAGARVESAGWLLRQLDARG
ncbi:NUDIX domain-containing protein [Microbacterium esteraromaticum]|uniref:NUDIX domain-containing protein n=1 Tax=Microbacterium esteraromaticum TaxID=57043 RepID=A0A7D7WBX2_9MICO|nr:NUDIX domain-containing protein [Microbacterium esteraromaticum]QMU98516.1 NUDIX domain-containing protein [Microbacterium esteraromaticum]